MVNTLPEGVEKIDLNDNTYYYFGGAFYIADKKSYKVVDAPSGAVVTNIPDGGSEKEIDDVKYVIYNHTYYQPLSQNGKDLYQVVIMDSDKTE